MRSDRLIALALAGASMLGMASSAQAASDGKPPSVFVQCDGKIGHVSGGERFMRILLVTATAGLSETGMASDNVKGRISGTGGVAACDSAIQSENDAYRRVELSLARAIHLGEDKKWDAAIGAAHAVPMAIPIGSIDRSLSRTALAASRYVEAVMLARAGRYAESEAATVASIEASRYEAVGLQRAVRLLGVDRAMSAAKSAAILHAVRIVPGETMLAVRLHAEAGDYRTAAALIESLDSLVDQFVDPAKRKGSSSMLARRALYLALAGDIAAARPLLAAARKQADADAASGEAAKSAATMAEADEFGSATDVALALGEQRIADARRLFGARERWALLPQGVTAALAVQIAEKTPAGERTGLLAKGDSIWTEARDGRVKLMAGDDDKRLWLSQGQLQVDERYAGAATAVWTGNSKPKMLIKGKPDARFDILSSGTRAYGIAAGEALLLHAALIAQSRNRQGFIILPFRESTDLMAVRFLDRAELGAGTALFVPASDVVAAMSDRFTGPVAAR